MRQYFWIGFTILILSMIISAYFTGFNHGKIVQNEGEGKVIFVESTNLAPFLNISNKTGDPYQDYSMEVTNE